MPVFEYRGRNVAGEPVSGTLFGVSLGAAADDLTRRGFVVEHLTVAAAAGDPVPAGAAAVASSEQAVPSEFAPRQEMPRAEAPASYGPDVTSRSRLQTDILGPLIRVPLSELMFFFRQLSTMLHAGVGMVQCLDTLSGQAHDPRLKAALREMREHSLAGRPLSFGMSRYPDVFTPVMLSLTRAGEESGRIDASLKLVAHYVEQEIELRNLYRRLTFWPKLLVVFAALIILGTNGFIAAMGKSGGIPTMFLNLLITLTPIVLIMFLFFRVGASNPKVRYTYDQVVQKIPYFGKTLRQFAMAKFGRAFGTLYSGGIPVHKAMKLAADACGNEFLRSRMYPAARDIEEGVGVTDAFARTGAFSPIVLDMTRTGETTGNLDQMLGKLSEYYEDEAKTRATQSAYVVFVVVYLLVAISILFTIILPFWQGYGAGYSSEMSEGLFISGFVPRI